MFAERLICSWIGALGLASGAFGQTYVEILVDGSVDAQCGTGCVTNAFSINNAGTVAGTYSTIGGREHGFVRAPDGTITTFDAPESAEGTVVSGINEKGVITGVHFPGPIGFSPGYVRDPERNFTTFNAPGSTAMAPQSINAGGAVTGWYFDGSNVQHGFVREDNGTITSFDPPGSARTTALSINAKGAITGLYQGADGHTHGFVRRPGGKIVSFDPPDSLGTFPVSINSAGVITGSYAVPGGRLFGFVRDPQGKFTSFDPGTLTTSPAMRSGINNEGAITGNYVGVQSHAFVRSPDGTITSFDAPTFCQPAVQANPVSINDEGVIVGQCGSNRFPGQPSWVRFP